MIGLVGGPGDSASASAEREDCLDPPGATCPFTPPSAKILTVAAAFPSVAARIESRGAPTSAPLSLSDLLRRGMSTGTLRPATGERRAFKLNTAASRGD